MPDLSLVSEDAEVENQVPVTPEVGMPMSEYSMQSISPPCHLLLPPHSLLLSFIPPRLNFRILQLLAAASEVIRMR